LTTKNKNRVFELKKSFFCKNKNKNRVFVADFSLLTKEESLIEWAS
jgi:hypothetical protein